MAAVAHPSRRLSLVTADVYAARTDDGFELEVDGETTRSTPSTIPTPTPPPDRPQTVALRPAASPTGATRANRRNSQSAPANPQTGRLTAACRFSARTRS